LSEVKQGVQHVLADIMAKDIEIINAIRQRCVSFTFSYVRQCLVLTALKFSVSLLTMCNGFIFLCHRLWSYIYVLSYFRHAFFVLAAIVVIIIDQTYRIYSHTSRKIWDSFAPWKAGGLLICGSQYVSVPAMNFSIRQVMSAQLGT